MRLATFNIYWLGGNKITRSGEDLDRIATVISKLDADVLALQEILCEGTLADVLERVNDSTGRDYRICDADGVLLSSGGGGMRVFLAYDRAVCELLASAAIRGGTRRKPCAAHLRNRATGNELTVVGLHLQSGYPVFDDLEDAQVRRVQCQHLADWLVGAHAEGNEILPRPPTDDVVVMGDLNAVYDLAGVDDATFSIARPDVVVDSLAPLREGHMADWCWQKPVAPNEVGNHSVYGERLLIDFVLLSPSAAPKAVQPPTIVAFDRDPDIGPGKEVSDHRPVVVELADGD